MGVVSTRWRRSARLLLAAALAGAPVGTAEALTINVVDPQGRPVTGYRWTLEEDQTFHPTPGTKDPDGAGVSFHRSYMPVVATGDSTRTEIAADPSKHYFLTVLPNAGYGLGGAAVAANQGSVTVTLNPLPFPTAQISVLVFEDIAPINNAPDLPAERGLAGFDLRVTDAGGRYGVSGGQMMQDVFGNPLGTTYQRDSAGDFLFDADGKPLVDHMGNGVIKTDANGEALIKYLAPGKYSIEAIPPAGQGWVQTSTIEGTKVIDAWVKENEPPFFQEFGPPGYHVFVGFVRPLFDASRLNGSSTITGQVVNLRLSRPPDYTFNAGAPISHTTPWIGLNDSAAGTGRGLFVRQADADGNFSIPNVPPGTYQLVVWDNNLDLIFALSTVTVPPGGGPVALGQVPCFQWFTRLITQVFNDQNENGFWDVGELPMTDVPVNIRFRDGSLYQATATDGGGTAPFDEVFPFFSWLVAEVDFARLKATGATVVVDAGGPVDPADPWSFDGSLTPQPQPENGNLPYRVETGPVLTQAFQGFLGQTNAIQFGKKAYGRGENGGISGVVYFASTRAEDDPRYGTWDPWEPGVPRVQVNLYQDANRDGAIDDRDGVAGVQLADVDNYPFGFRDGGAPGAEDLDRGGDGAFDEGDALQVTWTDSWDDNQPTGCPGNPADPFYRGGRCYDGMRNWNQVRPGVFDGGYAFNGIPAGVYIVEAVPPRGAFGETYKIVKEEDKNVVFGESFVPSPLALPPLCVGEPRVVPPFLSLFPDQQVPTTFAGQTRPLCDRKQVLLSAGRNGAADFFLFTEAPVAGHIKGFILDDTANEFDPNSPQFGEKYAPPWLPVSIRDWTGREVSRVYADEWGNYDALVPSTYRADVPSPSGYSPSMMTACMNDPVMPDPARPGQYVLDPHFDRRYSQFCYTFQYMPGTTTYLDTPVVRVAAFAGPDQYPLDCEARTGTPRIYSVSGPVGGPYVPSTGRTITLLSVGQVQVPNPAFDLTAGTPKTIARDYGFGATRGAVTVNGVPLTINSWSASAIVARVPSGVTTGQLLVRRGDNGVTSPVGITLTVGGPSPKAVPPGGSIQAVIDLARPNDLILVPPGVWEEALILWKPVKLQGWGEGSTILNAVKAPAEKLAAWRQKLAQIVASGQITLLPGQNPGAGGIEPALLFNEEGSGVLVLAKDAGTGSGGFGLVGGLPNARIDGLTITGADHGGGVVLNGYARYMVVSNNRIVANNGYFGGGIRVGHPQLTTTVGGVDTYVDAKNLRIRIHHNHVAENGALDGAGAGISIHTGAEDYQVTDNYVCGNFTGGDGAGIAHFGYSDDGVIARNTVIFNQSFNQGRTVNGGGVLVAGSPPLAGQALSPGTGTITVEGNLIQGNLAGAGDGGGLAIVRANGQDVAASPGRPQSWWSVFVLDNLIVNNVAALAGGGIAMHDAVRVVIGHDTIAHNDSVATAGEAFAAGSPSRSTAQPAGIVSRAHTPALASAFAITSGTARYRVFSNPLLVNSIVWENRSFLFQVNSAVSPPSYELVPGTRPIWDLSVLGATGAMDPQYCVLTSRAGYSSTNRTSDPLFVSEYYLGARNAIVMPEVTTAIQPVPAFDEGGNFIDVRFGPLSLWNATTGVPFGNYHLRSGSPALRAGTPSLVSSYPGLADDFDGQRRPSPSGTNPDIGADEVP